MKQRYLLFIPVCLFLPLLVGGAILFSTLPPEVIAQGLRGNALDLAQAANTNQADAQQCYTDQGIKTIASRSANAGDGRMVFALKYCPSQGRLFGDFGLVETNQSLPYGGCFYIQNELTLHGQGGFEGGCPSQINPGNMQTHPTINDGQKWQACWIDYSATLPKPVCTDFQQIV